MHCIRKANKFVEREKRLWSARYHGLDFECDSSEDEEYEDEDEEEIEVEQAAVVGVPIAG